MRISTALSIVALLLTAPATAAADGPILYVGDSLGVGTFPQLHTSLAGERVDGDTEIGRGSSEGLSVLHSRLSRRHEVLIFDLGTNDPSPAVLSRNLRLARRQTGERLMVIFTLNKPGAAPFNRELTNFARSTEHVLLIDWHSIAAKEHLLGGDGIHASPSGYRRRAVIVSRRLRRTEGEL